LGHGQGIHERVERDDEVEGAHGDPRFHDGQYAR